MAGGVPACAVEDRPWSSETDAGMHCRGRDGAGEAADRLETPCELPRVLSQQQSTLDPFSEQCRARWAPTWRSLVRILVKGVHPFTCAYEDAGWMRGEAR